MLREDNVATAASIDVVVRRMGELTERMGGHLDGTCCCDRRCGLGELVEATASDRIYPPDVRRIRPLVHLAVTRSSATRSSVAPSGRRSKHRCGRGSSCCAAGLGSSAGCRLRSAVGRLPVAVRAVSSAGTAVPAVVPSAGRSTRDTAHLSICRTASRCSIVDIADKVDSAPQFWFTLLSSKPS